MNNNLPGDIEINANLKWLESNFPCKAACPVGTEAGRYVNLIAQGKYAEAYRIARKPNPFASICGRICAAPCEDACRRGKLDAPISIRALKRFVTERFGVESLIDVLKLQDIIKPKIKNKNKLVAVIGAGPAGLACAHDLALQGYSVTVFEKHSVPGGMLRLGIPEYRLPRELIRLEINAILSLGIELKLGKELGKDFSIDDLKENGYEAVFLSVGAHKNRTLNIEGSDSDGVLYAVDYLLNINLGYKVDLGEKIVVIGGGNVAFDVARSAIRQEKMEPIASSDITAALDVARSAVRFGAKKIDMVVLEPRSQMLADEEEIEQAHEERIAIQNSIGPKRIIKTNGKVTGLEVMEVASLFDENGRFNPKFVEGSEKIIEADSIVIAIGQKPELDFISPHHAIELTNFGTIKVDPLTLSTSSKGIYAGGDAAFGPRLAIMAIADGRKAAKSIDEYLSGENSFQEEIKITALDTFAFSPIRGFTQIKRQPIPVLPIQRRVGIAQVELCYDEEIAQLEASRCLRCWENTIYEGDPEFGTECILCGGCSDVCPENCIDIIPKSKMNFNLLNDNEVSDELERIGYAVNQKGMVIIKNEEICIRCGLCAKRCPAGTITMQSFEQMPALMIS
jgi:NADPH-dependent glutamate synthase beta subunit-like oxidoreductase/NAD-dependent dihydropyrimidine dehydrogenase PreA subunit